ncbi:MAG: hypothetical protein K0R44_1331, partial [Thermomicrobiales bacterium]|nr:hypothetical protein [Thermomicrobiales bacterium]
MGGRCGEQAKGISVGPREGFPLQEPSSSAMYPHQTAFHKGYSAYPSAKAPTVGRYLPGGCRAHGTAYT